MTMAGDLGRFGEPLGWALIHFMWQGVAVALMCSIILFLLRKRSANARYAVACAGLLAMAAAPIITVGVLAAHSMDATPINQTTPAALQADAAQVMPGVGAPSVTVSRVEVLAGWSHDGRPIINRTESVRSSGPIPVSKERFLAALEKRLPNIVQAWAVGVLLLALRLAWSFVEAFRLRRMGTRPAAPHLVACLNDMARRFGISRMVELMESAVVRTPTVLGALKPIVLLPASALTGLTPQQLDAIFAHELAHIRRHDYLVNLFQTVIETLLFYHPAVWWVSARIRAEREHCCDDLALAACGDRATYAHALALLAEHYAAAHPLSMASTGGALLHRILRILGREPQHRFSPVRWAAGVLAAAAIVALGIFSYSGNVTAQSKDAKDVKTQDAPLPERTLQFPEDRSIGGIRICEWGPIVYEGWQKLGDARGSVAIPAGKMVLLELSEQERNLDGLAKLPPDAIQAIMINQTAITEEAAAPIRAWKSLRGFDFDKSALGDAALSYIAGNQNIEWVSAVGSKVTDAGLKYLKDLTHVRHLDLADTAVTDAGLDSIASMTGLTALCLPAGVTDAGLARLAQLPQIKKADFNRCALTGEGLVHLAKWSALTDLALPVTLTSESLAKAADALKGTPAGALIAKQRSILFRMVEKGSDTPLSGLVVTISSGQSVVMEDRTLETKLTTDQKGEVRFSAPAAGKGWYLSCSTRHPGYVPMKVSWNDRVDAGLPDEYTLRLEKGTSIGGIIQDEAGTPISNATVYLLVPGNDERERVSMTDEEFKTDAEGRWRCDAMPAKLDDVWIRLAHPDYASDTMYGTTPKPPMEKLRDKTGVMVMKKGATVLGAVTDPEGKPVVGASVVQGSDRWGSEYPSTSTNEKGEYVFKNCQIARDIVVTVQAQGYAPDLKTLPATAGESRVDFKLEAPGITKGQVVDSAGQPVPGITVVADTWRGHRSISWRADTDKNGRFVWDSAPKDSVKYDIVGRDWRSNRDCRLAPSAEEQRVVMYRPLVVKGKVTDKATGEPLKAFNCLSGTDWGNNNPPYFDRNNIKKQQEGMYEWKQDEPRNFYVRVEADGYLPATSRLFDEKEGEVTFDFVMEKGAGLQGTVTGPDGKTVAGAKVYISTRSQSLFVTDGKVENSREQKPAETDKDGRFSLQPQSDKFMLAILHDSGYAEVSDEDTTKPTVSVTLKSWGRVEGTYKIGTRNAAGETCSLFPSGQAYNPERPRVSLQYQVTTDGEGHFAFERVTPGDYGVSCAVRNGDRTSYNTRGRVTVVAEQTVRIDLGGTGRPVTGRIVPEPGHEAEIDLNSGQYQIVTKRLEPPKPENADKMTREEMMAWYKKWSESPEGKAAAEAYKSFTFLVRPDGSFRAEDVPPGNYTVFATLNKKPEGDQRWSNEQIANGTLDFTIPEMSGGRSDEPLDVGTVPVKFFKRLDIGAAAPEVEGKTLDDKPFKLSDLRGKYVLLDFWATWCGPCRAETPNLLKAHEAYKDDTRLSIVGMNLDVAKEDVKRYIEESKSTWPQVLLGEWQKTDIPNQFGIRGVPTFILLDPEGKVVTKNLRGPLLQQGLEKALGAPKAATPSP